MTSYDAFAAAIHWAYQHPDYIQEFTEPCINQLWLAAALTDRLEICGSMAFSWLRCDGEPDAPPSEEQWRSKEGQLWISDVVASPSMSGLRVGKTLRRQLVSRGIAREGEKVYFFRYRTGRIGSLIARGGM